MIVAGEVPDGRVGRRRVRHSISMLGWALNEEGSLEAYIDRAEALLRSLTDDFELIIIDDGSRDRTSEIAEAGLRTRPWLRTYRNDRNRGPGFSCKRAMALASIVFPVPGTSSSTTCPPQSRSSVISRGPSTR